MFHIHCGYKNPDIDVSLDLIKMFDLFLGIPSIVKDQDNRRRTLYGKAGCFRQTPYGFEYRTLSAAMYATPELTDFVYTQVMKAIDAYNNDTIVITPELAARVQETINSGNVDAANEIINQYNLV